MAAGGINNMESFEVGNRQILYKHREPRKNDKES
jgi:hypothetical protein